MKSAITVFTRPELPHTLIQNQLWKLIFMFKNIATAVLLALSISSFTHATTIYSPTPHVAQNADGLDLRWNKTEANYLQAFDEARNIHVTNNQVNVDYLLGGNLFQGNRLRGGASPSLGQSLLEGDYNSHLIHFDPIGTRNGSVKNTRITFGSDIVAIILNTKNLRSSDAIFGGLGTQYLRNGASGLERHDFLTFESSRTLLVDRLWVGKYWIDDARIITQSVPEPGSMALLGLGLVGLFGARSFTSRKNK